MPEVTEKRGKIEQRTDQQKTQNTKSEKKLTHGSFCQVIKKEKKRNTKKKRDGKLHNSIKH